MKDLAQFVKISIQKSVRDIILVYFFILVIATVSSLCHSAVLRPSGKERSVLNVYDATKRQTLPSQENILGLQRRQPPPGANMFEPSVYEIKRQEKPRPPSQSHIAAPKRQIPPSRETFQSDSQKRQTPPSRDTTYTNFRKRKISPSFNLPIALRTRLTSHQQYFQKRQEPPSFQPK